MRLIGFNFHKIKAEKKKDATKETKANTNINILDISSLDNALGQDKGVLKVDFSYSIEYAPNVALMEFEGNILLASTKDEVSKVVEAWKDKKLNQTAKSIIFNVILRKANIKALELENELNLPLHIPMPQVKAKVE